MNAKRIEKCPLRKNQANPLREIKERLCLQMGIKLCFIFTCLLITQAFTQSLNKLFYEPGVMRRINNVLCIAILYLVGILKHIYLYAK